MLFGLMYLKKYHDESTNVSMVSASLTAKHPGLNNYKINRVRASVRKKMQKQAIIYVVENNKIIPM